MPDDDQRERSGRAELSEEALRSAEAPQGRRGQADPRRSRISSQISIVTVTGVAIAALLAIGVVIAALDMKFQADQARWQQRQTCLEWYRLQADYGLGPWYEKLPAAAEDCGGEIGEDGVPLVPGGTAPALTKGDVPGTTTTIAGATSISTTTTTVAAPTSVPSDDGTGGP